MSEKRGYDALSDGLQKTINRRRFLVFTGGAAATLLVAACGDKDAEPEVDRVEIDGTEIPEPGGEPLYSRDGRFYLINNDDGLLAIYTKCTHQGCTVEWKSERQGFECPCHGSKFDRNGIRTDGPAERPLDLMAIRQLPDGSLVVETNAISKRSQ